MAGRSSDRLGTEACGDVRSWCALDTATTLECFGSTDAGLSDEAARLALGRCGPNALPRKPPDELVRLFVRQFAQPLIYVLLAAAGVTAALAHWIDAGVIVGVVVANAVTGVFQEHRAGRAIDALLDLVAEEATVVRDSVVRRIDARELVPGDVGVLVAGDKVPADCRLLGARGSPQHPVRDRTPRRDPMACRRFGGLSRRPLACAREAASPHLSMPVPDPQ